LLYAVVPNRTMAWRNAIAGGVAAGILFSTLRWAFGMYLAYFPIYGTIYGALSAVPIRLMRTSCFIAFTPGSGRRWRQGRPGRS